MNSTARIRDLKDFLGLTHPDDANPEIGDMARHEDPLLALKNRGLGRATSRDDQWIVDLYNSMDTVVQKRYTNAKTLNRTRLQEMLHSVEHLHVAYDEDYARPRDFFVERESFKRNGYGVIDYHKYGERGRVRVKVGVIGGSISGLMTGLALLRAGHDVWILEKSRTRLMECGSPLQLQPKVYRYLKDMRVAPPDAIGLVIPRTTIIRDFEATNCKTETLERPAVVSNWQEFHNALKRTIRSKYPDRYVHDAEVVDIKLSNSSRQQSRIILKNTTILHLDLILGAFGRECKLIKTINQPHKNPKFFDHICVRGWVPETLASPKVISLLQNGSSFVNYAPVGLRSHVRICMIPGKHGQLKYPYRRVQWSWYLNTTGESQLLDYMLDRRGQTHEFRVPLGKVRDDVAFEIRENAKRSLPGWVSALINSSAALGVSKVSSIVSHEIEFGGKLLLVGEAACQITEYMDCETLLPAMQALELVRAINCSSTRGALRANLRIWAIKMLNMAKARERLCYWTGSIHQQQDDSMEYAAASG
ncbi:hypothetical protein AAMO2058_000871700 [Amorphochlora amoebiformis]